MLTYEFISDPGHGWLKVPLTDLNGFKPSQYSFKDGEYAYLEEDCDAHAFLLRLSDTFQIRETYVNYFNRDRERFAS
jgi:hypothetical protein